MLSGVHALSLDRSGRSLCIQRVHFCIPNGFRELPGMCSSDGNSRTVMTHIQLSPLM